MMFVAFVFILLGRQLKAERSETNQWPSLNGGRTARTNQTPLRFEEGQELSGRTVKQVRGVCHICKTLKFVGCKSVKFFSVQRIQFLKRDPVPLVWP